MKIPPPSPGYLTSPSFFVCPGCGRTRWGYCLPSCRHCWGPAAFSHRRPMRLVDNELELRILLKLPDRNCDASECWCMRSRAAGESPARLEACR